MTTYMDSPLGKDSPTEHARLSSIQSSIDSFTQDGIRCLTPARDWDCLELGAGAGSIAYWLAAACPQGRTVAVDIDTRYLERDSAPNLTIVRADIGDPNLTPGQFDLIHARFVLCHVSARDEVLTRAARWLKPGGWLVITDPYQLPPETSPFPVIRRLMEAYELMYRAHGADLTWVRSVPSLMAAAGLTDIGFTARPACMGNLEQDRWRVLVEQVAPSIIEAEPQMRAVIDEFRALLTEPGFVDIPQVTISVWGRASSTQQ